MVAFKLIVKMIIVKKRNTKKNKHTKYYVFKITDEFLCMIAIVDIANKSSY